MSGGGRRRSPERVALDAALASGEITRLIERDGLTIEALEKRYGVGSGTFRMAAKPYFTDLASARQKYHHRRGQHQRAADAAQRETRQQMRQTRIEAIRSGLAAGQTLTAIARELHIDLSYASKIASKHLFSRPRVATVETLNWLRAHAEDGISRVEAAQRLGVTAGYVSKLIIRERIAWTGAPARAYSGRDVFGVAEKIGWLREHADDGISRKDAARQLGVTPTYVSALIRRGEITWTEPAGASPYDRRHPAARPGYRHWLSDLPRLSRSERAALVDKLTMALGSQLALGEALGTTSNANTATRKWRATGGMNNSTSRALQLIDVILTSEKPPPVDSPSFDVDTTADNRTRLIAARNALGLTPAQMAERLMTPRQTYVQWESGQRRTPGVAVIAAESLRHA